MEKLWVTIAREHCQLHGINIEPVEIVYRVFQEETKTYRTLWGTFIKMTQGKNSKITSEPYLQYTMQINGETVKGWEDTIDELWLKKSRQIIAWASGENEAA